MSTDQSTPEALPPPPQEILVAQTRRLPPRRYPLIGFGVLAVFIGGTLALEIRNHGRIVMPSVASPRQRPDAASGGSPSATRTETVGEAFVRSARALRPVQCLDGAKLPLEPACRMVASESIRKFSAILRTQIGAIGAQLPAEARDLRPIAIQLNSMTLSIVPIVQNPEPQEHAAEFSIVVFAGMAKKYVAAVNKAFNLDDPRWKSDDPADQSDEGVAAPVAAEVAGQEAKPASETAKEDPAAAKTEEDSAGSDDEEEKAGKPGTPPSGRQLIESLATGISEVYGSFSRAGHQPQVVIDAIRQARPALERVEADLQRYRSTPRSADETQRAQQFVTRVDQARGRLLRASMALQHATIVTGTSNEPPFREADELLDITAEDVRMVEVLAKTAP